MINLRKGLLTVTAVAAVAAAAVLIPGANARADSRSGAQLSGQGELSAAGQLIANVSFSAVRVGPDPTQGVTGSFTGAARAGLISLAGPVTCLDVEGNTAGFLYPAQYANPAALQGDVVLISLSVSADGSKHANFLGPAPAAAFHGCAPTVTPLDYTGSLTLSDLAPAAPAAAPAQAFAPAPKTAKPAILAGSRRLTARRGGTLAAPVLLRGAGLVSVDVQKYVAGRTRGSACTVATGPVPRGSRCKAHRHVAGSRAARTGDGAQRIRVPLAGLTKGGYFVVFRLVDRSGRTLSQVSEPLTIH